MTKTNWILKLWVFFVYSYHPQIESHLIPSLAFNFNRFDCTDLTDWTDIWTDWLTDWRKKERTDWPMTNWLTDWLMARDGEITTLDFMSCWSIDELLNGMIWNTKHNTLNVCIDGIDDKRFLCVHLYILQFRNKILIY